MDEIRMKVAEAVSVLNHDSQSCNRVAANQWLVHFQQTPSAWDVSTSILTSPPNPNFLLQDNFELDFFAAQILKRKVLQFSSDYHKLGHNFFFFLSVYE